MPLEHFGSEAWRRRPLSDSGSNHSGTLMTRAASDGYDDENNRSRKEETNKRDDGGLSKLSGVTRSVSWGRGTAQHRPPSKASKDFLSKNAPSASRPGWKSHHARASLSMSPSIDTSQIPRVDNDMSSNSPVLPTSSPASSAALSLRSVNSTDMEKFPRLRSLENNSNESSAAPPTPNVYESTAMLSPSPRRRDKSKGLKLDLSRSESQSPTSATFPTSLKSAFLPSLRGNKDTTLTSPTQGNSKRWISAGPFSPLLSSPRLQPQNSMNSRISLPNIDADPSYAPVRRHMGSFYTRTQHSNPDLNATTQEDKDGNLSPTDLRPSIKLRKNIARLFHDSLPSRSRSGSNSPWPLSPRTGRPSQQSTEDLRSSTSSLRSNALALSVTSILPRPPQSPMFPPEHMDKFDLSDEDGAEIHGLTTRSAAPSRPHSPAHAALNKNVEQLQRAYLNMPVSKEDQIIHSIEAYEVGKQIGSGAYGFVHEGWSKESGDEVVIKYIIKNSIFADSWRRHRVYGTIPGEIFVLLQLQYTKYVPPERPPLYIKNKSRWNAIRDTLIAEAGGENILGHPGICKLADFFEDDDYYYMVMPKFGNGEDLFDYVESSPYGLDIQDVRSFLGQIIDVIAFMHANGIVHRDIKDENVILDKYGMIQVIDFGSAAKLRPGHTFDTFSGTMDYAAAEILRGERYEGPPQDIWAYGVLAYVLVCGECPFHNMDEANHGLAPGCKSLDTLRHFCLEQSADKVNKDNDKHDDATNTTDGGGQREQLYDLICLCLQVDPAKRPNAQYILRHQFFVGKAGWLGWGPDAQSMCGVEPTMLIEK